jgi:prepilin-type N-terminal cleavage/methylation domain-containing protein
MRIINRQDGFTLVEILIAVAIMAFGFLAIAEMQYLSFRQKQKAELGTIATNIIQFVGDRDMAEVKRLSLLNSVAFSEFSAGRNDISTFEYCDGTAPAKCTNPNPACKDPCTGCPALPCDVMRVLSVTQIPINNPNNFNETSCTPIETSDSDPEKLVFVTSVNNCTDPDADMYIIKNVMASQQIDATGADILTVTLTYAVKTPGQFAETGLTIIDPNNNNRPILRNSVATQTHVITAHIDDWSQIIPGWTQVRVPHIP